METQETAANPTPVAETVTQAPEADQVTDESVNLDAPVAESESQEQPEGQAPVDDDSEDVEWEGKTFKAPKGVKDGILRQADYTKKTMALAEQQKAWQAHVANRQEFIDGVASLRQIDRQLEQYAKTDFNAWHQQNPSAAQAGYFEYQQLRDQRAAVASDLDRRVQEQDAAAEREYATRVEQELASLNKPDPERGWTGKFTTELKTKLETFARSIGYADEHLSRVSANDVKTLHLAMLGQEYLKQQRALAKPQVAEAKPVPKVSGGRGANLAGPPDDMDAYVQWRKRGGGGRR